MCIVQYKNYQLKTLNYVKNKYSKNSGTEDI